MQRAPVGRTSILVGCLVALVTCSLSSCVLLAVAFAPALGQSVSDYGEPGPEHDITMIVKETYLNQEISRSLPTTVPGAVTLDVQPGNRLVATATFDLAATELQIVTVLSLSAADGRLEVTVLSVDVAGQELLGLANLIGVSGTSLGQSMAGTIHDRIQEGLGRGAQILDVRTDEAQLTIRATMGEIDES